MKMMQLIIKMFLRDVAHECCTFAMLKMLHISYLNKYFNKSYLVIRSYICSNTIQGTDIITLSTLKKGNMFQNVLLCYP